MTSNEAVRAKYKLVYKECLAKLTQNEQFVEYWKKLGLYQEGYHFDQIQEKYREDATNILCFQFSSSGTTNTNKIFMNAVISRAPLIESTVDWSITTGLGNVVLNKYNKVCAVTCGYDICDTNPNPNKITDKKLLHLDELVTMYENNSNIWCEKIGNKKKRKEWKMGQVYVAALSAVTPSLAHKGLVRHGLQRIIIGMMGYKLYSSIMTNKITIKWAERMNKLPYIYAPKPFDFSNFIFDDGTRMIDYYNKLETKYGFTKQYVSKVKDESYLCFYIMDYTNISNKSFEGWIRIWKECTGATNTKIKFAKL